MTRGKPCQCCRSGRLFRVELASPQEPGTPLELTVCGPTAAGAGPLAGEDLERLAVAAYLVGEDDVCAHAWEDAHRSALEAGDGARAARCAVLLSLLLFLKGQTAKAGGWLARAERVLGDAGLKRGQLVRVIGQQPAGIGIRESNGLITNNLSRFVPHLIL